LNSDNIADALSSALTSAGKSWKQAKRQADREDRVRSSDLERLRYRERDTYISEAVEMVMEQAYLQASGDGEYPANARQIMYVARPLVLELTGDKAWKNSAYFTQVLLPKFIEDNPDLTADWDVVYDARGNLNEPHGGLRVPLGTLEVRDYIAKWDSGEIDMSIIEDAIEIPSRHRFITVLFVEKEGFHELLKKAEIAERYDVAIMSTKGMTVTACRSLIDFFSERDVRVMVAHDFDKAGLGIYHTMISDSDRYIYENKPNVIELGLRLDDVQKMKLTAEPVNYPSDPTRCLRDYGCTTKEIKFLYNGYRRGQRVELNAMTSPQFIKWLEKKFAEHGVEKFVPADAETLRDSYIEATKYVTIKDAVAEALKKFDPKNVKVPRDLAKQLRKNITGKTCSWSDALVELAETNQARHK
jgi:hypothetical protein